MRSSSGGTPLLFRGNRAPTPRREEDALTRVPCSVQEIPQFKNITDSLLDFDKDEKSKWQSRMLDEAELGLDFEGIRNVDRQWYDSEESSYFQHEGRYDEDSCLGEKEEHLKYRQVRVYHYDILISMWVTDKDFLFHNQFVMCI